MKKPVAFLLGAICAICAAQTIDYGDLNQYEGKINNPPSLTGTTVWLSGKEEDGITILLSADAEAKVSGVLEGCGQPDDKCYKDVLGILTSSQLELDPQIERRHLGHLLSKTFKGYAAIFATIADFLTLKLKMTIAEHHPPSFKMGPYHIPSDKASEIASVHESSPSSVVLSAGGSAVLTITPTPTSGPTLTGSVAPSITSVPDENGGSHLKAILDKSLAAAINEAMNRMTDCEDGHKFDDQHKARRQINLGPSFGGAICAAEGVAAMAGKGGPFGDLLLLDIPKITIDFSEKAPKARDALVVVKDFVLAYGPMLAIPEELASQLSTYLLALAIEAIMDKVKLTDQVDFAATVLVTSTVPTTTGAAPPSKSTPECPDPTTSPLWCGWETGSDCGVDLPPEAEMYVRCKDGPYKFCECFPPTLEYSDPISPAEAAAFQMSIKLLGNFKDMGRSNCNDQWSEVQINDWKTIYPKFCAEVKADASKGLKKTYKSRDFQSKKRSTSLQARGLPEQYDGLEFNFEWSGGMGCDKSCEDSFNALTQSSCGGNNGVMRTGGSLTMACGRYSYSINKPEPQNAAIRCHEHPLQAPRTDKDANGGISVEKAIEQWCSDNDGHTVTKQPGVDTIFSQFGITDLGVPNRSSFWLRATYKDCKDTETSKVFKDQCVKALTDGLNSCDKDQPFTHGHTASLDCIEYAIDLSGVTQPDNPPWNERPHFPAPEFATKKGGGGPNQPICDPANPAGYFLSDTDLNKAIDAYCQNGKEIKGYDKYGKNMFRYPEEGQQQFYGGEGYSMHLTFGARTVNDGDPEPYEDMGWCKDYDWKLGKDDCTYALRRLYQKCTGPNEIRGGDFTYRCVHYRSVHVMLKN